MLVRYHRRPLQHLHYLHLPRLDLHLILHYFRLAVTKIEQEVMETAEYERVIFWVTTRHVHVLKVRFLLMANHLVFVSEVVGLDLDRRRPKSSLEV